MTDLTLLVIHRPAFMGLLDEQPGIARRIMASMAGIIRRPRTPSGRLIPEASAGYVGVIANEYVDAMTASETTDTAAEKRFRPRHIALIVGFGFAGITALSFIAELLWAEQWNVEFQEEHVYHPRVLRQHPRRVPARLLRRDDRRLIVWGAITFSNRMRNWERGAPDNRQDHHEEPEAAHGRDLRAGLYMQTLLRDPAAGIMHSLMYFSFLILLAVTTIGEINLQLPPDLKFLHRRHLQAFAFVADVAGARVRDRRRLGDRAPLRPAARTASASSRSPSTP